MSNQDIELLKNIRRAGQNGERLTLSPTELYRLDKIIKTYDKCENFK